MLDYDVIIIGSGPAGATAARLLPAYLKVALIDKSSLPSTHNKVCGGLLAPDAQRQLAKFGLTLPKDILVSPQIFAVKTVDLSNGMTRHYQRSYLNMNRERFDEWMNSLIPNTVDKICGICREINRTADGFSIICTINGETVELNTKYIVGADGANSIVRKTLFPKKKIRRYAALQRWFKDDSLKPFYSCVFDRQTTNCCSWSISKDGYLVYGGAFAVKNCRYTFEKQLKRAQSCGFEFGEPVLNEACIVNRPKHVSEIFAGNNGAFLIGEAGGFISPSSLEGISWAMRTGECLANAFTKKDPMRAYKKSVKPIKLKLWLKMLKCPFMYNPLLRKIVMALRINTIDVK